MQWNLIPQLFYDMIGRFCPGAIVIATAWMVWEGPSQVTTLKLTRNAEKISDLPVFAYILLTLVAYFIADMLYQVWCMGRKLFPYNGKGEYCFSDWNELRASICNWGIDPIDIVSIDQFPANYIMLDYLRTHKSNEAVRLLKLKAECRLSAVIVIGYSLLVILNPFIMVCAGDTYIERLERGILEVFMFLCAFLNYYREKKSKKRFENGVTIAWLMCVFDEKENRGWSNNCKDVPDGY